MLYSINIALSCNDSNIEDMVFKRFAEIFANPASAEFRQACQSNSVKIEQLRESIKINSIFEMNTLLEISNLHQVCYDTSNLILQHWDHSTYFATEALLIVFIFYIFVQCSYKEKAPETLSSSEIEALIEEWQPEPLVAKKKDNLRVIDVDQQVKKRFVVESAIDRNIDLRVIPVNGKSANAKERKIRALNMTTLGVLGAQNHPQILAKSEEAIRRYGPGSCGPRGFYGTIDVHIELEQKLATFVGFEEAVLFGSGFAKISSVIPAFSKQTDYLIVDKACNYAIQTGVQLSRSEVRWFNHNDMKDLESILQSLKDVFAKKQQKVFVIVEGLYGHTEDLAPLRELIALKSNYPIRLIVDESNSLGVIGEQGRGLVYETVKQLPVPGSDQPPHVEIVCASLGGTMGAIGGVALGTSDLCAHMRLNCSGYVYSCSNPPYVTAAACALVDLLSTDLQPLLKLQDNIRLLQDGLAKTELSGLTYDTCHQSPIVHLNLKRSTGSRDKDEQLLQIISDKLLEEEQICVLVPRYVKQERFRPDPSLRICVSYFHNGEDIERVLNAIAATSRQALNLNN